MQIISHKNFAKEYVKLMMEDDVLGALAYVHDTSKKNVLDEVFSEEDVIDMMTNLDTEDLESELKDVKDYYDTHYDEENPDCGATLLKTEKLLDYLRNCKNS